MASFVLKVISLTLGIFFVFIGTLKLTPSVNKDLHKEMRKMYIKSSKVFPLTNYTGWRPNSHMYRKVIGGSEVVCGVILAAIPGPLKEAANVLMIGLTLNDLYAHYSMDNGLDKSSLSIVFFLLLTCRLIIHLQIRAREYEIESKFEQEVKQGHPPNECVGHTHIVHPNAGAGFRRETQEEDKKHK